VTTPFTFIATLNAIDLHGATPVLVDIDPDTLAPSPEAVRDAITSDTAAVVPVHFGGLPVDTAAFDAICQDHGLWLIEDAAHAFGAIGAGHRIGHPRHDRHLTCFSFYPNKNLASAEGGAITLRSASLADRLRRLRLHGLDADAWQRFATEYRAAALASETGHKANWTDLQAAIGLVQLEKAEGLLATREMLADHYDTLIGASIDGITIRPRPRPGLDVRHALHLYQVIVEAGRAERDRILLDLRSRGIGAAVHYIAVHLHPAHRNRWTADLPNATWASEHLLSLPLHPGMSTADVERVVSELAEVAACRTSSREEGS
jgi:UDP-4-amino-4-deoxy-L-arabinose-oxoglutarate aminotransferase